MAQKTKATMPGRQCSTENKEQGQHTRHVAGGQSLGAPEITGTAPLARFTPVLAFTPKRGNTQYFPQWGECEPVAGTLILRPSLGGVQILPLCSPVLGRSNTWYWTYTKNAGQTPDLAFAQPFGSMPRDCSSFLRIRFIQVASDESPSLRISSSSCERNSSFNRIGNCGERFSGIDMVYAIGDIVRVYASVYANDMKAQRPVVLGTHTGRLTTNR